MKKIKYCLLALLCPIISIGQSSTISGKIINMDGAPVSNATITYKPFNIATRSGSDGLFLLTITNINISATDSLQVSAMGYLAQSFQMGNKNDYLIILNRKTDILEEVTINTGYQLIPKERATGSFFQLNNDIINRSNTRNIIDRIENLAPGLLFNRGDNQPAGSPLTIRGRSTIYANSQPLIILDNFPYDGDINNINPNDIESITMLRDAAASSIWGARAGNGVLVITTKKGKTSKPLISYNSNITLSEPPNIENQNLVSSSAFIELEKYLFEKGFYNSAINSVSHPPLTPVVELLIAQANGSLDSQSVASQIELLKRKNIYAQIEDHLYRNSIRQQHAVNISGKAPGINYYFSAGFDKGQNNLVGVTDERITVKTKNNFSLTSKLKAEAGITFSQFSNKYGDNPGNLISNGAGKSIYPYASLVDENGIPIPLIKDYRQEFIHSAHAEGLLNWQYIPLSDMDLVKNTQLNRDYLINASIQYNLGRSLNLEMRYQYEYLFAANESDYDKQSYFSRNLVNQFTQVDDSTGFIIRPVPVGGIYQQSNSQMNSHQGRLQVNFNKNFNTNHQLIAIGGAEIKSLVTKSQTFRYYGYSNDGSLVFPDMDYNTSFPRYGNSFSSNTIPNPASVSLLTDRFVSFFGNAAYSIGNRYTVSGSARQDASNLFGVKTNQQAIPLWSMGLGWQVSNEKFYAITWLPDLKLKATYGVQGNISRHTSAYTTATYYTSPATGALAAEIQNPPNERLSWERVRMFNLALSFAMFNNRFSGNLEYYRKYATNLMGKAPIDGTMGLAANNGASSFFGNVASIKGNGFDVDFQAILIDRSFKWQINTLVSHVKSIVSDYYMGASVLANAYMSESFINPVMGKPLYSLYSFPWAGLDATNGNPQGYLDGQRSNNYTSLVTRSLLDSVENKGSIQPALFGAWRNTFSWNNFNLSINTSYKFNYYFRRPSVNYNNLYNTWSGHNDFEMRWQKPGDESITTVPSLPYPANLNRDRFYNLSSALVEKADHIRLEDIHLSYDLKTGNKLPFQQMRLYLYAGIGAVIWTANDKNIDPYYINSPLPGRSLAIGFNIHF